MSKNKREARLQKDELKNSVTNIDTGANNSSTSLLIDNAFKELVSSMYYQVTLLRRTKNDLDKKVLELENLQSSSQKVSEGLQKSLEADFNNHYKKVDDLSNIGAQLVYLIQLKSPQLITALNAKDTAANYDMLRKAADDFHTFLDQLNIENHPVLRVFKSNKAAGKKLNPLIAKSILPILKERNLRLYEQITHNELFKNDMVDYARILIEEYRG